MATLFLGFGFKVQLIHFVSKFGNLTLARSSLVGGVLPFLVLSVITDVGPLPADLLLTLAPPGRLGADRFRLEHEALGLDNVEEQLADHVGITGVGHLEAGAESLIAAAVADRVRAVVEQVPLGGHARDIELAVVVLPAAHIGP